MLSLSYQGSDKKVVEAPSSSSSSSSGGPILNYSNSLRHVLDDVRGSLDIITAHPDNGNSNYAPYNKPFPDMPSRTSKTLSRGHIHSSLIYPLNLAATGAASSSSSSSITIACRIPTAVYIRDQVLRPPPPPPPIVHTGTELMPNPKPSLALSWPYP